MDASRSVLTFVSAVLLAASSVGFPGAASRLTEDLVELLKMANAVVEVEIVTQQLQPDSALSLPVTLVTVRVSKVYKGEPAAGAQVLLEVFGGDAPGQQQVVVSGQPRFENHERALLLLVHSPLGAGRWRVLGGEAGQIHLRRDSAGRNLAVRASGIFDYYVPHQASLTGYQRVELRAIAADEAQRLVEVILKTGRPVLVQPAAVVDTLSKVVATEAVAEFDVVIRPTAPTRDVVGTPDQAPFLERALLIVALLSAAFVVLRRRRVVPMPANQSTGRARTKYRA